MRDPRSRPRQFEELSDDRARCRAVAEFRIRVLSIIAGLQSFTGATSVSTSEADRTPNEPGALMSWEDAMSSPPGLDGPDAEIPASSRRIQFTVVTSEAPHQLLTGSNCKRRSSVIEWDGEHMRESSERAPSTFGGRRHTLS